MHTGQYRLMYHLEDKHWWFLAKRKFIQTLLPDKTTNLKILDIGCGTGGISKFLQKWGKVTGVEPSREALKYLKKGRIEFVPISFQKFSTGQKYDLICFFDVLYHQKIDDDQEMIKKAFNLLKKHGKLIITDCALPYFYGPHDQQVHARQRYYLSEMTAKVKSVGFNIKKSSYIYFFTFPLFAFSRLIQKLIPSRS